jgi:hypothetical protein
MRGDTRTPRVGRFGLALAGTPNMRPSAAAAARRFPKDLRFIVEPPAN